MMLSTSVKRWLCTIFTVALLLSSLSLAEEPVEEAVNAEELGEIDLLSPEIYSVEAMPEEQMPESEPSENADVSDAAEPEEAPTSMSSVVDEAPAENVEDGTSAATATFPSSLSMGVKEQISLNGAEISGGLPVSYVSSKPKVAAVDENGTVMAHRKGEAVITCYQGDVPLGECHVTVLKAPKKVLFPDKSIVLSKDQACAYPAMQKKGYAGKITYASDNPAVLMVDAEGNLLGVSGGTATLTATTYNGRTAQCSVRVLGGPAPSWIKLNESSMLIAVKGSAQLTASYDEGRDAILTYTTSDKRVARVSNDGLVTARKAGSATITVTTHNGLAATCEVQVYTLPTKVKLNAKKLSLYVNDAYQLTATLSKNSISDITWASDNPNVAAVDANGLVIAESAGVAVITATTVNGKSAKCKITVKGEERQEPAIDGVRGKVVYHEESDTLKVTIANDNGVYLTYIWAENPSRQFVKHYGNSQPGNILQEAVNKYGLQNKIVIGFNASPPVNSTYYADWNRDPKYHYREPSPLMIANGQVLVNDPTKSNEEKYLYWLDGDGQLRHSGRRIEDMTVAERASLYSEVIASGARNTIIWQPVLITDHKAFYLDAEFLRRKAGDQKKQALCQMDDGSFILVSSSEAGKMTYPEFQKYLLGLGCKTAVEFDAGGSTSLLWKSKNSGTVQRVTGGGRSLTMVMFFTE